VMAHIRDHISFVWQLTSNDQETPEEAGAKHRLQVKPRAFLRCFSADQRAL
jgi:hypothetical protein